VCCLRTYTHCLFNRNRANDHIAKLKKMNTSLQKSYNQQDHRSASAASPAFIPSSAVMHNPLSPNTPDARHRYWYGEDNENGDYNAFFDSDAAPAPAPRVRSSEYDEKFVAWKVPEHRSPSPEARLTSFNSFQVDANVANWKSESKASFQPAGGVGPGDESLVAGVVTKNMNKYPTSFAWNLVNDVAPVGRNDPSSPSKKGRDTRSSEHDLKFQWPATAEVSFQQTQICLAIPNSLNSLVKRVIYTNPEKQFAPFPKDHASSPVTHWKSEYDSVNSRLTNEQKHADQAVAGKSTKNVGSDNPKFYAWEDVERKPGAFFSHQFIGSD
jgi:hypothetical protein